MKKLSREATERARTFVREQGRPLEAALLEVHLGTGPPAAALKALRAFQNPDGGFGHGLEPDFTLPDSSPMATSVAFQVFSELGLTAREPMVSAALGYLLRTFDDRLQRWVQVPPAVADHPRAPWWQPEDEEAQGIAGFKANPGAELVGHLWHFGRDRPEVLVLLERVTPSALDHLDGLPDAMEMHDLLCYMRLAEAEGLPAAARERVAAKVIRAAPQVVDPPDRWSSYGCRPVWLATRPSSIAATRLSDLEANLDFEIDQQRPEGQWEPFWSWGDAYPEAWPLAKKAWSGVLTLKLLRSLNAFGRLE